MKEIIKKVNETSLKIRNYFGGLVETIDSKTSPENGALLYKIFKIISLCLILIGIPVIGISFGVFALGQFPGGYPTAPMMITAWTFFSILFTSLVLWFWFAKFNTKAK